MGKIGDLIVRLKLHYKDYEKGLKEAEKHRDEEKRRQGQEKENRKIVLPR